MTRDTSHSSGSVGASQALHKGLTLPVPVRKRITHPQHRVSLPAMCGLSEGRWGEALTLMFFPRLALPCSFLPPSPLLHCCLVLCVLSRHLFCPPQLCFLLADPQEALQKGKGESLGLAGRLSRQQRKVRFVTPRAFDHSVKGDSKVKKKKKAEQIQLMKQMPGSGTSRDSL